MSVPSPHTQGGCVAVGVCNVGWRSILGYISKCGRVSSAAECKKSQKTNYMINNICVILGSIVTGSGIQYLVN